MDLNFKIGNNLFLYTPGKEPFLFTKYEEFNYEEGITAYAKIKLGELEETFKGVSAEILAHYFLKVLPAVGKVDDLDEIYENRENFQKLVEKQNELKSMEHEVRLQVAETQKNKMRQDINDLKIASAGGIFTNEDWGKTKQ